MSVLTAAYLPRAGVSKGRRVYLGGGKRVMDVVIVVLALPFAVPMIVVAALLLRSEGGYAFYWQDRIGRHGRVFAMLKLRSMVPNADAILDRHLAANPTARAEWDKHQKLQQDPRVTRLGRILRATSLDELPQIWNVLTGDMSIVGPRPMMVTQREMYPGTAYFSVRPGLTGLWQVSRRNATSFAARARFDTLYCRVASLRTDLAIIVRTVRVVVRATGC